MSRPENIAIIGAPGSGKSYALRALPFEPYKTNMVEHRRQQKALDVWNDKLRLRQRDQREAEESR